MKGMMNLLEKVGLVRQEGAGDDPISPSPDAATESGSVPEPAVSTGTPAAEVQSTHAASVPDGQTLEQVYATHQIPACSYPAERLLRLVAGLNAMDEALRRQTIHAIDTADESWTIDDPLGDAAAKVAAIEQHASGLRAGLGQAETQAQAELAELRRKQEAGVAEVKRQIAELEGLLTREITRGAQECAGIESALQLKKEAVSQELATLSRAAADFRGLIAQFKNNLTS